MATLNDSTMDIEISFNHLVGYMCNIFIRIIQKEREREKQINLEEILNSVWQKCNTAGKVNMNISTLKQLPVKQNDGYTWSVRSRENQNLFPRLCRHESNSSVSVATDCAALCMNYDRQNEIALCMRYQKSFGNGAECLRRRVDFIFMSDEFLRNIRVYIRDSRQIARASVTIKAHDDREHSLPLYRHNGVMVITRILFNPLLDNSLITLRWTKLVYMRYQRWNSTLEYLREIQSIARRLWQNRKFHVKRDCVNSFFSSDLHASRTYTCNVAIYLHR